MIKRQGSLFDTTAPAFGHGVNCAGVMGAGIAKPIKDMFPNNFRNYEAACRAGQMKPGDVLVVNEHGTMIFNMATQFKPGKDARYEAVFSAGYQSAKEAIAFGVDTIAIPMIGCGIGGLEWSKVEKILLTIEEIVDGDFQWEVWKL